jgi:hypothetical protein
LATNGEATDPTAADAEVAAPAQTEPARKRRRWSDAAEPAEPAAPYAPQPNPFGTVSPALAALAPSLSWLTGGAPPPLPQAEVAPPAPPPCVDPATQQAAAEGCAEDDA